MNGTNTQSALSRSHSPSGVPERIASTTPSIGAFALVSHAWWRAVNAKSHFAALRQGMRTSSVSRVPLCDLQSTLPAPFCHERIPVLLRVGDRHREARFVLVLTERVVECVRRLMARAIRTKPVPSSSTILADGRSERGDVLPLVVRQHEMNLPPGRAAQDEVPVEPPALRVAQVGRDAHDAVRLVDPADLHVPARIYFKTTEYTEYTES